MALALSRGGREVSPKEGVVDVSYTKFTRDKIKREWGGPSQLSARKENEERSAARARSNIFFTYHHH